MTDETKSSGAESEVLGDRAEQESSEADEFAEQERACAEQEGDHVQAEEQTDSEWFSDSSGASVSSSSRSSSAGQKSGRKMTLRTCQTVVGPVCWAEEQTDSEWFSDSSGASVSSSSRSSSAGQKSGRKMTLRTCQTVVGPVCWADMEDPRRNARDGNLTWEESLSNLGALKDDAQPIGYGRCGVVCRKQFGEWDLAIKILQIHARREKDEATVDELRAELNKEARLYRENIDLQGKVIPRFFGLRTLQIADCFITEYMGPSFESFEKLTKKQYESALKGLSTLHRRGILAW